MMAHACTETRGRHLQMHMALETRAWTRADLVRLPDDGNKYEVLGGVLLVTPAPSPRHQRIVAWLNAVITPFVAAHGIGVVHQARSVVVVGDAEVEPDLMVLPQHAAFDAWEDAPTPILVVEVLSSSTRRRDLHEKQRFYVDSGVDEYWVVDRYERSVVRMRADGATSATKLLTWSPKGAGVALDVDISAMFNTCL